MPADDDDLDDEPQRLFVARWPDGSAMLVAARSLEEVADRLDEIGDPGACEVAPYDGPFALSFEPAVGAMPSDLLEPSFHALDDSVDVQRALMRAAFPELAAATDHLFEDDPDLGIDRQEWSAAVAREMARDLRLSAEWAEAVKTWWEEMSGGRADRTAALRERMNVTIPGEPRPTAEVRRLFEAEHRRITERIARNLMPAPDPSEEGGAPSAPQPQGKSKRSPSSRSGKPKPKKSR